MSQSMPSRDSIIADAMKAAYWKRIHQEYDEWRETWAFKNRTVVIWFVCALAAFVAYLRPDSIADFIGNPDLSWVVKLIAIAFGLGCLMFINGIIEVLAQRHCRDAWCEGYEAGMRAAPSWIEMQKK